MKLTRIKAGEKFVVREGAYNAFCDVAEANAPNIGAAGGRGTASGTAGPALTVQVKNNTGVQLEAFETFCADHNLTGQSGQLTIDGNEYAVGASPIVCIGSADRESDQVQLLITLEPIPIGEIGRAVIRGLCIATVDIVSTSHLYADLPSTGSILRSGNGGRVRILQLEESATGEQYCLVDLIQSSGGESIVVVNSGPTDGLYTGQYAIRSTTSPYSYAASGPEIRIIPIDGGRLVTNSHYIGKTVGTVTISDVTYDLVDVVGHAGYTTLNGSGVETAWGGGTLNTTTQSIKGVKTFRDSIKVSEPGSTNEVNIEEDIVTIANATDTGRITLDATNGCLLFSTPTSGGAPVEAGAVIDNRVAVRVSSGVYGLGITQEIPIPGADSFTYNLRFEGGILTAYYIT